MFAVLFHPTRSRRRRRVVLARFGCAIAGVAILGAVTAQAAEAHVSVHADSTQAGSFSQLTFRVPNESETSGTVTVQVTLPQNTPFLDVSTKPLPGWTATVTEQPLPTPVTVEGTTITKAPRTVTWQAQAGAQIEPGQYQDFDVSVGPLPAAGTVRLPATQTYSDGKVVAWDQPIPAGGTEPEHPAPELVVTAATSTATVTATSPATSPGASVAISPSDGTSTSGTSDPVARLLGGAALVVALAGTALALGRRRSAVGR